MVLGAVFLILATSGAEAVCVSPKDREALSMRLLQTELMVAALSCQRKSDYNTFVRRFETELVDHGKTLKRLFKRTYGAKTRQLDSFVTRLANQASQRSLQHRSKYCEKSDALFSAVMATEPRVLIALADRQTFSDSHGIAACTRRTADKGPTVVTR